MLRPSHADLVLVMDLGSVCPGTHHRLGTERMHFPTRPEVRLAAVVTDDKKAIDTLIIDVGDVLAVSDHFVITSAANCPSAVATGRVALHSPRSRAGGELWKISESTRTGCLVVGIAEARASQKSARFGRRQPLWALVCSQWALRGEPRRYSQKKKLKCQRCGKYNDTGSGKPYDGPAGREYRKEWKAEQKAAQAETAPPSPAGPIPVTPLAD